MTNASLTMTTRGEFSVSAPEVATANQRHSQSGEVTRGDGVARGGDALPLGGCVAYEIEGEADVVPSEHGGDGEGCAADAGQGAELFEDLVEQRDGAGTVIPGQARIEVELDELLGAEAGFDLAQVREGAQEEAGGGDQHESHGDLRGHQGFAQAHVLAAIGAAACL